MEEPPQSVSGPQPVPYQYGPPLIACPFCGSPQFFGEKKFGRLGLVIVIIGAVVALIGIPLLFLGGIGLCPIIGGLLLWTLGVILMIVMRKHVNRCARCKKVF
jgi:hypothetical protein